MTIDLALVAAVVIFGGLTLAGQWWAQLQAQGVGAQVQAGKTDALAAKVSAPEAQAIVDAPTTKIALIDRLNAGAF
jgi:hypothetical protein